MNEKIIIEYLEEKLDAIDSLKDRDTSDVEFKSWENSVKYIMRRLGKDYEMRMESIHFTPMAFIMGADNHEIFKDSYNSGLESARAVISSTIDEIKLLGISPSECAAHTPSKDININVNQSVSLVDANLGIYDDEVRRQVKNLQNELRKRTRDKNKIKKIIEWLLDKGTDALIAIIASSLSG